MDSSRLRIYNCSPIMVTQTISHPPKWLPRECNAVNLALLLVESGSNSNAQKALSQIKLRSRGMVKHWYSAASKCCRSPKRKRRPHKKTMVTGHTPAWVSFKASSGFLSLPTSDWTQAPSSSLLICIWSETCLRSSSDTKTQSLLKEDFLQVW